MDKVLVNSLMCALACMRGTGGGYSPHEKNSAIERLELLLKDELAKPMGDDAHV